MKRVKRKERAKRAREDQELKRVLGSVPAEFHFTCDDGGEVKLEAAAEERKLRRFTMTAYTGGAMVLAGWPYSVVVDLAGLRVGRKNRPILKDHDPRQIVGHSDEIALENSILSVAGVVSGTGAAAHEVIDNSDNGFPWQASLGARARKVVFVAAGKTAQANGREFSGPVYMVRRSVLGEVSFVALGADDDTSAKVAASRQVEVMDMDFIEWLQAGGFDPESLTEQQTAKLKAAYEKEVNAGGSEEEEPAEEEPVVAGSEAGEPGEPQADPPTVAPEVTAREEAEAAVKAERDRVASIQGICAGEFGDIEREAISAGWDVERTSQAVLKAMRENRPTVDVNIQTRDKDRDRKTLEAALCLRAGLPEDGLVKEYGEQAVVAARPDRNISMQELIIECARLEGEPIPRTFGNDTIRAGFSTVSLPGILNNVANKRLLKNFLAQPIIAPKLCSEGDLDDFKESQRYRLTDVGDLEAISADGELKHGRLTEEKATNQLDTYGKTFALTRKMIINDDLNAFMKVPEGMGARAARKIDQLFFMRLLANPGALFSTAHKNYKAGADTALSGDSLAAALQMFLDQVDADKQPINVPPKYLLVPTALKMIARELLHSVFYAAVGSTDKKRIPTYNAIADEDLDVIHSPYLANTQYQGASQKAWYLFADPTVVDTFEIGYLKGRRTPTVERGETDFNTLGMQFRVYFDLGVREQDHRGVLKFKGEA